MTVVIVSRFLYNKFYCHSEAIVETDSKFAEAITYALCNLCTGLRLDQDDTVEVVNAVILGDSPKEPVGQKLKIEDFTRVITKDSK